MKLQRKYCQAQSKNGMFVDVIVAETPLDHIDIEQVYSKLMSFFANYIVKSEQFYDSKQNTPKDELCRRW